MDLVIVREKKGYALIKNAAGHMTVVGIDRDNCQVTSAMPGDMPREGGRWFGRISDSGIEYVSKWYSQGYARQIFSKLSNHQKEYENH